MTQYQTNNYGQANNVAATTNNSGGNGANTATIMGGRIAGPPTYTPAYIPNGSQKTMQAQCRFTIFQNARGKRLEFDITAWGKMADIMAKGGATGKNVSLICAMNSYKGKAWFRTQQGQQPSFATYPDGTPLLINKVGFTIQNLIWGQDSAKAIQEEIQTGRRPMGWNDPTNPGHQQWMQMCTQKNAEVFQQGMQQFGYARVQTPSNGQIVPTVLANNVAGQTGQANYQQHVQQPQNQQPQNQQVMVNGQPMGNAMPQQPQQPVNYGYAPAPGGQTVVGDNRGYTPQTIVDNGYSQQQQGQQQGQPQNGSVQQTYGQQPQHPGHPGQQVQQPQGTTVVM